MNIRSYAVALLVALGLAQGALGASSPIGAPPQSVLGLGPNVLLYGATGNGSTDDSNAFTQACGAAFASGSRYFSAPTNSYSVASLYTLGATFTGVISGNTLTASSVTGTLGIGQLVSAATLNASNFPAVITKFGTGAGGSGTYALSGAAQTVSSVAMTAASSCLTEIPTGNGSLINNYRKWVFDTTLPSALAVSPTIMPGQLPRMNLNSPDVIVIMGDSTWSDYPGANTGGASEYAYPEVVAKIYRDYAAAGLPQPIIYNRGIPGSIWANPRFAWGGPIWPSWYTDHNATWNSYVQALNPTKVILAWGVNDGAALLSAQNALANMLAELAAINGWQNPPSIILATNLQPSTLNPVYNTQNQQEWREWVAGDERTYAQQNGLAYLDFGRRTDIIRDGFDPLDSSLVQGTTNGASITIPSGSWPFTFPSQTHNFSIQLLSSGTASTYWSSLNSMTFQISQDPNNVLIVSNQGGFFAYQVNSASGLTSIPQTVTSIPITQAGNSNGDMILIATIKDDAQGAHLILNYGSTDAGDQLITRGGGLFTPTVTLSGTVSATTFAQGLKVDQPKLYMPTRTDLEVYGSAAGTYTAGGNGGVHPASFGAADIYNPVIEANSFAPSPLKQTAMQNLIINGEMQINQQKEVTGSGGNTLNTAGAGLFFDRWRWRENNLVNRVFANQSIAAPTGHSRSILLGQNVNTNAPGTADFSVLFQLIEGPNIADLGWGSAGAFPVNLGFCAEANNAGTYPVSLANQAQSRSYASSFTLAAANAWQCFNIVVPGDTAGTWVTTPGNTGLAVQFAQGFGSTFTTTTTNAWQATQFYGTASMAQLVTLSGGTINITGVTLIKSGFAGPVIQRPYADELQLARRFYSKTFAAGTAPAQNAGLVAALCVKNPIALGDPAGYLNFPAVMAATPAVTTFNPSAANANWRDVTAAADATVSVDPATALGPNGVTLATSGTVATLGDVLCIHATADVGF